MPLGKLEFTDVIIGAIGDIVVPLLLPLQYVWRVGTRCIDAHC